jgi:hypothetical protein
MAHIVSTTPPPGLALGDEWYNPSTNKLFKLIAVNGNNVSFQDYTAIAANAISVTTATIPEVTNLYFTNARVFAAISGGSGISIEANGRISSTAVPGAISESFSPFMLMGA